LGPGETAAIALAAELHADLLLMDDRRGVAVALRKGPVVTGTMGLPAFRLSAVDGQALCEALARRARWYGGLGKSPVGLQTEPPNKEAVYGILFRTTAETLNPQHLGAEIGLFAVLHS
jgi:hypothetical protein